MGRMGHILAVGTYAAPTGATFTGTRPKFSSPAARVPATVANSATVDSPAGRIEETRPVLDGDNAQW